MKFWSNEEMDTIDKPRTEKCIIKICVNSSQFLLSYKFKRTVFRLKSICLKTQRLEEAVCFIIDIPCFDSSQSTSNESKCTPNCNDEKSLA